MRALLLIAHGSRRLQSNQEIERLSMMLAQRASERYGWVGYAFLELVQPDILTSVQAAVQAGTQELIVLPYFLAPGSHVAEDIPRLLALAQQHYPQLKIQLRPYLGSAEQLPELLLQLAG